MVSLITFLLSRHDLFVHDLCVQFVVIVGVWYMSLCECSMLVETTEEMGVAGYAAGNFFVHYFPSLSAVYHAAHLCHTRPDPTASFLWIGYNCVCIYYREYPSETYGCNVPQELVLTTGTVVSFAAALALHRPPCVSQRSFAG